jgi:membrane-bound lytic murein transglycosylase MltF
VKRSAIEVHAVRTPWSILWWLALAAVLSACRDTTAPAAADLREPNAQEEQTAAPDVEEDVPLAYESALPAAMRELIDRPFTGDLDEMEQRRMIRVAVTANRTHYFVDKGVQRGLTFEYLSQFEQVLNAKRKTRNLRIDIIIIPMARDRLLPSLAEGRVDAAAAQLTITTERQEAIDFSIPLRRNVSEIVVTAPTVPPVNTAQDLAGLEVVVRPSSSYYQSLRALNQSLERAGRPPVAIVRAPESLEDDDLLEMVNAGLIERTVVDDYLAEYWSQMLPDFVANRGAVLRTGADLAVAFRKNSPRLAAEVNAFIRTHGIGSAFGNTVTRRYLQHTRFVSGATGGAKRQKFLTLQTLFRKYSDRYSLDYLLMMAQGYQESRLNHAARSRAGAIGVMQVLPATGKSLNVGDIRQLEPNIHAGVKYVRRLMDRYLAGEPMDEFNKTLFTFASYNAGPSRMRQLRREAERRGLDPNVWFQHVERIVAQRIGRETVSYVSNIYKYYIAYRLIDAEEHRRMLDKQSIAVPR